MLLRFTGTMLLMWGAVAGAAGGFRPANFDYEESKQRMDRLIKFPEVKGNISVLLSCFSQIQTSGKMSETGCFMKDQYDQPYVLAVAKAAKKARMNPALIDGKAQKVYLQFQVMFKADGDDRIIRFLMNPGYQENVDAYGVEYTAGQRVIGSKDPWTDACPKRAQYAVWVRAYLGPDGRADKPTIVHADGIMPVAACQDAISQTIVASRYTPAMSDGEPVPSTYIELFGN